MVFNKINSNDDKDECLSVKKRRGEPKVRKGKNTSICGTIAVFTNLSIHHTVSDIVSRPRQWCFGVLSVFLVVFFSALVLIMISKIPYIMLRFGEIQVGEIDVLVLGKGEVPFVNYSEMGPIIDKSDVVMGSSPRWMTKGHIVNWDEEKILKRQKILTTLKKKGATIDVSDNSVGKNITSTLLLIDSENEKKVGIGRAWPYREIGFAEVQVYHSILRYINVLPNKGKRVKLFIDTSGPLSSPGGVPTVPLIPNVSVSGSDIISGIGLFPNGTAIVDRMKYINFPVDLSGGSINKNQTVYDVINGIETSLNLIGSSKAELKLTVADAMKDVEGKYPSVVGNMAVLDYRTFVEAIGEQYGIGVSGILGTISSLREMGIENIRLDEHALMVVVVLKNRFEIYYLSQEERFKKLIHATNSLFLAIGVNYAGEVQYPLSNAMDGLQLIQLFLNSYFATVVVIIVILGVLFVYMLLAIKSEERQFEVAMMRAQGMNKPQLFHLMVTHALAFVIPGVVIAIFSLLAINTLIEMGLSYYTKAPPVIDRIPIFPVVFAVFLGLILPVVANWKPIRSALTASLRDSLDVYRQKNSETQVTIVELAKIGLEPWQIMLGIFLTVAGFVVFYLMPLSFIFNNLYLFLLLINSILLTMIFGMCLVSYSFQGVLESGILKVILWGDRKLSTIIHRNLLSHKERNSLTFMMFTISVAYVVFAGVLFTLLAASLSQQVQVMTGADIMVQSLEYDTPLDRPLLEKYLEEKKREGRVKAFAFVTFPLLEAPHLIIRERISPVSQGESVADIPVVGVDQSLQDALFSEFLFLESKDESLHYMNNQGIPDVVRSIYNTSMSSSLKVKDIFTGFPDNADISDMSKKYEILIPCIMASSVDPVLGLTSGSSGLVKFDYRLKHNKKITTLFLLQPRALVTKFSGFPGITSLRTGISLGSVLVSIPSYEKLLRANESDYADNPSENTKLEDPYDYDVKYQKIFIKLSKHILYDEVARTEFVNDIQSLFNPYYHVTFDTQELLASISDAGDLIIYFFFFISAVCLLFDALMLWLAFVRNVQRQAWTFGVLRALGFRTWQLTRMYVYEALSIVLASFFVGTLIGILVAISLVLQMNLFLDLPFSFVFPTGLFCFLLCLSLFAAIAGSIIPVRAISKIPISSVLKTGD